MQCAQARSILQWTVAPGLGSSSLPHMIASAFPSLANLSQMTSLLSQVFFVIVDCHFVTMSPLYIGSLPDFCWLFAFVFLWVVSTCVLICHVLLLDGFPSFDFYLQGISLVSKIHIHIMQIKKTIMLRNMPPGTSKPLRPCHCPFQNFESPYQAHLKSSWAPYHAQWLVLGTYVPKYSTLYHCMHIFCTLPVPGTYVSGYGML